MLMKALSNRMLRFRLEAEVWVVLFFFEVGGVGVGVGAYLRAHRACSSD